jgi:LysR family transcriptional regulator, carnitine catabolism transcriptional activator
MNVTVKQLKAFVAVAQTRSFAEACAHVHLSQPALSIAIKNLEGEVGGQLLARTTRTLALTPEGESFYPVAKRLLADWDGAILDLHNHFAMRRGKLSVASMPSFAASILPQALVRYRRLYPRINVAVQDVIAENVVEMVRDGRVELGVSFDPGESEGVEFQPLFQDKFVAVFEKGHELAKKKQVTWRALQSDPFLALQWPSAIRQLIDKTAKENQLSLKVEFEAHQLATIGRMVACGLGVSAVPSLCTAQMERHGAVCRSLINPTLKRRVGIITRQRYPVSAAAQAMIDVMVEHVTCAGGGEIE